MAYSAQKIAEWFLRRANQEAKPLSQMKLQKLVYIAHGWSLGLLGEPLINESIEAWKWGPVVRSLYREFADFGSNPIVLGGPFVRNCGIDEQTVLLLERVWSQYGNFSPIQLASMTHEDATPWQGVYRESGQPAVIPNESIKQHYRTLAEGQANART